MQDLQNANGAEIKHITCINVNESQVNGSHQSDSVESDYSGDETSSSQVMTIKTSAATKKKGVRPEVPEFLVERRSISGLV